MCSMKHTGTFDMRCASDESVSLFSATEASAAGLCGIESRGSLSAFCESLDVLDSPYTCGEASHESFIRGGRFRLNFVRRFFFILVHTASRFGSGVVPPCCFSHSESRIIGSWTLRTSAPFRKRETANAMIPRAVLAASCRQAEDQRPSFKKITTCPLACPLLPYSLVKRVFFRTLFRWARERAVNTTAPALCLAWSTLTTSSGLCLHSSP